MDVTNRCELGWSHRTDATSVADLTEKSLSFDSFRKRFSLFPSFSHPADDPSLRISTGRSREFRKAEKQIRFYNSSSSSSKSCRNAPFNRNNSLERFKSISFRSRVCVPTFFSRLPTAELVTKKKRKKRRRKRRRFLWLEAGCWLLDEEEKRRIDEKVGGKRKKRKENLLWAVLLFRPFQRARGGIQDSWWTWAAFFLSTLPTTKSI